MGTRRKKDGGARAREQNEAPPTEQGQSAFNALVARLFAPVDISSIVVFRIAFGLIMLWEVNRYLNYGWIDDIYIDPLYHFPYQGFEWVRPWPGNWMHVHFYALGLLAILITVGLWYRVSAALFWLEFTYVFLLEKGHYLNHLYLVCLISFLMIFVPAHRSFSLDARRNPKLRSDTVPAWALVLLVTQISVIYIFGGLAKLNGDWLRGEPMRRWLARETDIPIMGRWVTEEWMVYFVSYGGLLLELFVVPLLLWRKTRWYGVVALILFHRLNAEMFSIGIFPTFATAAIILFLPPDLPRRVVSLFQTTHTRNRRQRAARPTLFEETAKDSRLGFMQRPAIQRATIVFLTVYIGLQLLIPLRHFAYPDNPGWTDQGDRFAWRMMLHSKVGEISFNVTDPESEETWKVDPDEYLTRAQAGFIVGQPDMILQFSHFLADEWESRGHDNVEVRAQSLVSFNGRDPLPLIDSTVDLATENLSIMPADWITSLDEQMRLAEEQRSEEAHN